MGEITKKTAKKASKKAATLKGPDLEARVAALEATVKVLAQAPEFVANETRNLFGFGAVAVIFDAVTAKLAKIGK